MKDRVDFKIIWKSFTALSLALPISVFAQYAPQKLNISGALYNPGGTAVTQASVDFKIEILDKAATCVLYSEDHLGVNLSSSKGGFSLEVGSGTSKQNYLQGTAALGWRVFENTGVNTGAFAGCAGGVTMSPGEERLVRVSYNLGSGMTALTPNVPITAASYALVADTLQGKTAADFIQVKDDVSTDLNQSNVETVFSATNYAKLLQLLNNTFSGSYSFNNQRVTGVATPTAATDAVNKGWTDGHVGDKSADLSGVGSGIGDGKTLVWDATLGQWTTAAPSATDNTKLPLAGGTMSGGITMAGFDIYNTGHITMGNQRLLQLGTYTSAQEGALALTGADAGKILYNTTANTVRLWNGSAFTGFVPAGAAGGDLTGYYPSPLIATSAVTTTKIANDAVTSAKINNTGIASSRLISTDATTGTTLTYVGCALNEVMTFDAAGKWTCATVQTLTGNSGVTAGAYGSATTVPRFGVNAMGAVTMAVDVPIGFPVTSVAGKTGAVTLNAADIGSLGTAALQDVGTAAGNVPQLDAGGKILVGLLPGIPTTLFNQQGASANQVLKWNGSAWLPANDAGNTLVQGNGILISGAATTQTIAVDTGITANKILQLDSNGALGVGTATVASGAVLDIWGTGSSDSAIVIPRATTANRPTSAINGMMRYNTSLNKFEVYENATWNSVVTGTVAGDNLGNHTATSAILAVTGAAATPSYTFNGDIDTGFWNVGANQIAAGTGGTERLRIDSSGNVGIGTNNAYARLTLVANDTDSLVSILNDGLGSNHYPQLQITNYGGTGNPLIVLSSARGSQSSPQPVQALDSLGYLNFMGAKDTSWGTNTGAAVSAYATQAFNGTSAGSVLALMTADNNSTLLEERIHIEPNGNVGVGTTTPAARLDIFATGSGAGSALIVPRDTTAFRPTGVNGMIRYNTNLAKFEVYENDSWVNMVSSGSGADNLGNHTATSAILAITGTAATPSYNFGAGSNRGLYAVGTGGVAFSTASLERLRIDPNGNVGIGTTSPTRTLEVSTNATPANSVLFTANNGTNVATLDFSHVGLQVARTSTNSYPTMLVTSGDNSNSRAVLQLQGNGGTNQVLFAASNGNVGIGTTSPGARLDIFATGAGSALIVPRDTTAFRPTGVNGMIRYNTNNAKFEVYENDNWVSMVTGTVAGDNLGNHTATSAILAVTGTAATPSYTFNGDTDTGLWTAGPNQIAASTGGTERMRIDTSGNIGIGTTAPTFKLDVVGNISASTTMTAGWGNASSPSYSIGGQSGIFQPATQTLGFTTSSAERMRIDSSGNVGIGTTTPAGRLDVYGTGAGSAVIVPRDTQANRPTGVNGMIRYNTNLAKFEVYENNSWYSIATSGGGGADNLGNHTATSAILAVTGTAGTPSYSFNGDTDTGLWAVGPNQIAASTGGTERLRIDSTGNVGIGTTSPQTNLDLRGIFSLQSPSGVTDVFTIDPSGGFTKITSAGYANYVEFGNQVTISASKLMNLNPDQMSLGNDGLGFMNFTTHNPSISWRTDYPYDSVPSDFTIFGANAWSGATTNITGGNLRVLSGPGASGSSGAANGGNIYLDGGQGYGTGHNGYILLGSVNPGKVGIGTTTPAARLDIFATGSGSAIIVPRDTQANRPTGVNGMIRYNTNLSKFEVYENDNWVNMVGGGAGDNLGNHTATAAILAVTGTASTPSYTFNGDTDTGLWAVGPNQIAASTGGTERLRIDSLGKVGIGTTAPSGLLSVGGNAAQNAYFFYDNANIASGTDGQSVYLYRRESGNDSAMRFYIDQYRQGYITDPTGNLGHMIVGTTGAGSILDLNRDANGPIWVFEQASSGETPSFSINGFRSGDAKRAMNISVGGSAANTASFTGVASYHFGGTMGVGTATPGAALDVFGTGASGNSAIIVPRDTTAFRPTGVNGMIRYNTNLAKFEVYENNNWVNMVGGGSGDNLGNHTATSAILAVTGTASTPSYTFNGDSDTGFWNAGPNQIAASTGGTERLRIDSSGNIGVGTSAPSDLVTVRKDQNGQTKISVTNGTAGSAAEAQYIAVNDGGNFMTTGIFSTSTNALGIITPGSGYLATGGAAGMAIMVNNASGTLRFATGGSSEKMRIDAAGNVGIGTTSPAARLDIFATGSGAGSALIVPRDTTAFRPTGVNGMLRYNTNLSKFEVYENDNWVNMVGGGAGDNLGNHTATAAILAVTGTAATPSYTFNGDSDTGFWAVGPNQVAVSTGGNERMRIDSSGNVGIGTSNVRGALHVNGYNLVLSDPGGWPTVSFNNYWNGSVNKYVYNGPTYSMYQDPVDSAFKIDYGYWGTAGSTVAWGNGFTLTQTGKIGIGTIAPAAQLDIVASGSATAGSAVIVPRDTTAFRPTGVNGMIRYNTNLAKFEVYENNNWTNMVGGGAGDNLGNHTATSAILAVTGTGSAPGYSFSAAGGGMGMSAVGTANLAFSTANAERMRIDSSGNVGIGTTAPGQKLTVAGTIESTSGGVKFPDGTTQTTAGIGSSAAVANAGGTPSIQAGNDASKPGAGTAGRLYIAADTKKIYYDTGATWIIVGTTVAGDLSGNISGNAANVTGTVAIANGGTGQTTQQGAVNALAGAVTNAQFLRGNGTNVVMGAIQASDVPTLNQNTTGTAANVTGTVAIANGGTGQTTAAAAFNALTPMTTLGDITYESGANTASRLAGNTTATKKFLTQTGTGAVSAAPGWNTIAASDVPTLNQNTTGTAANVTGTVAIANGGTGQTTRQAAMNALAGAVTNAQFLRGNGSNVVMGAIQASDVPTLNQNTTGTAANVTGTVAVANGGTGATTAATARTNLGLGSVATINTNASTSNYLRGDGTWVTPPASADQGTMCGLAIQTTAVFTCKGSNPAISCPSGYTLAIWYDGAGWQWATCYHN